MSKLLLTPTEAAEITGISENNIRKLCDNDPEFPSFKFGRDNKIGLEDLKEWISIQCKNKSRIPT